MWTNFIRWNCVLSFVAFNFKYVDKTMKRMTKLIWNKNKTKQNKQKKKAKINKVLYIFVMIL